MLITAAEGLGKSTLLRQLLVCAAAGLHPFTQSRINPIRCLGFDYENGRRLSQDRYGPLVGQAHRDGRPVQRGMLHLEIQPRGVNLLQPGAAVKVLRVVERHRPQLVMIGPIYRLHEGDPNDERDARKVSVVLDQIREIDGAAVITEAHMAKAGQSATRSLNPVGSGLWMRWPEYGYGLVLADDSDLHQRQVGFRAWRGPRDERAWPELLMSGMAAGRPWPWVQVAQPRRTGFVNPYEDSDDL
jgi:replicative DNA helicase